MTSNCVLNAPVTYPTAIFFPTLTDDLIPTLFAFFFLGVREGNQCGAICDPIPAEGVGQSDPVAAELGGECRGRYR